MTRAAIRLAAVAVLAAVLGACEDEAPQAGSEPPPDDGQAPASASATPGTTLESLPGEELEFDGATGADEQPIRMRVKPIKAEWRDQVANQQAEDGGRLLVVYVAGVLEREAPSKPAVGKLALRADVRSSGEQCPAFGVTPLNNQDGKYCYEVSKIFGPPAVPITEDWQNHDWKPTYGQATPAGQVLVSVVGVNVEEGEDIAGLNLCAPTGKTGGLADDTWPCVPVEAPAP